jgi:glucose-6-phosphate 1-dehydrogenase
MEQNINKYPCTMVLFGATGDLSKRKLFPALYSLYKNGLLPEQFAVVGVARKNKSQDEFCEDIRQSVLEFSRYNEIDSAVWNDFKARLHYYPLDVSEPSGYSGLKTLLSALDRTLDIPGNRLFYLAMAPEFFGTVSLNIKAAGMKDQKGWNRLVIEKPFGHDYNSAQILNEQICEAFSEQDIYRIDHYLGKEMVQNIEVIRFANSLFEPIWNSRHIANIQITSSETVGVEERGGYYEKAGALRDMFQNHMLQMVMMMAMEPPSRLKTEAIRDEKVKVLRSVKRFTPEEIAQNVVRGQYGNGMIDSRTVAGYRQEPNVSPVSKTETFIAAKLFVDNFRWAGVPFYIRTGKRMAAKSTEIVVQFKDMPKNLYHEKYGKLDPNLLVIRVNPFEGMYLKLNAKKQGTEGGVMPFAMEFCQSCEVGFNSPEAYERLLYDCIEGDSTFFTRWDEVSIAWKLVDPIAAFWEGQGEASYPNYSAGTWGPDEARELLEKDGFRWWPVAGEHAGEVEWSQGRPLQLVPEVKSERS